MRISHDIRRSAANPETNDEIATGLRQKSQEFTARGGRIYIPVETGQ